jgi:hypothetical protein
VPRQKEDFSNMILQDVPIQSSGQLCVNVTISFHTEVNEVGVMYFEARDPKTEDVQYFVSYAGPADSKLWLIDDSAQTSRWLT